MARALPSITGLSYITVISLASTGDNKGAFVNKREREEKGNGQEELKEFAIAYQKPVDYQGIICQWLFWGTWAARRDGCPLFPGNAPPS